MTSTFQVLSLSEPYLIIEHLHDLGWIRRSDSVESVERAGEGNMNLVARVTTSSGSFIFKQSRPWVEKYPQIAAPQDRLLVEVGFYQAVFPYRALAGLMPGMLAVDPASRSAKIQDLGKSSDCTFMYCGERLETAGLVEWLAALHSTEFSSETKTLLRNREMRDLNHAHIFDLPMSGAHGMDLDEITPGLGKLARGFRASPGVAERVRTLGEMYLADGHHLLHGDFYPGSWLSTNDGLRIIDPEFCFFGPAEFDLGVFQAHLAFAGYDRAGISSAMDAYSISFDEGLCNAFAGAEIMRRLIGVAQLPFAWTLEQKEAFLARARTLLAA